MTTYIPNKRINGAIIRQTKSTMTFLYLVTIKFVLHEQEHTDNPGREDNNGLPKCVVTTIIGEHRSYYVMCIGFLKCPLYIIRGNMGVRRRLRIPITRQITLSIQ